MKTVKKWASFIITLALCMQMVPAFAPQARAVIPQPEFAYELGLLLRGFNALAEAPVGNELDKREVLGINFNTGIFNNNAFSALREYLWWDKISPLTDSFVAKGNSVTEYANSYGATTGGSANVELGISDYFKFKIDQKWSRNNQNSFSESTETMFFQNTTWRREATYDIDFHTIPEDVIQSQLTTNFKEDLLYASPEYVFNKYGTHFLTKYSMGGWIDAYIYSISNNVKQTFSERMGFEGNVIAVNEIRAEYGESTSTHVSDVRIYGGSGGVIHTTNPETVSSEFSKWTASFTDPSLYEILTIPSPNIPAPIFEGIWELLPEGHEDRYYELIQEYITRSEGRNNDFFDNFVYKNHITSGVTPVNNVVPTTGNLSGVVGTGASPIPANAIYISKGECYAEPQTTCLADIGGSDSAGKYYVLANDIPLSGNWSPINDFRGTLDGNGYKITNLYVTNEPRRQRAGLFGQITTGNVVIKNLGVHIGTSGINAYGNSDYGNNSGTFSGGLIGQITGGVVIIQQSYVTGSKVHSENRLSAFINHAYAYAGGLIGDISGGSSVTISNSYADVDVESYSNAYNNTATSGGLVGDLSSTTTPLRLENCYTSASEIIAHTGGAFNWRYAGDTLGRNQGNHEVTGCYRLDSDNQKIIFRPTQNSGDNTTYLKALSRTPAQLRNLQSYSTGWNFSTIWENYNNQYPRLRQFYTNPAFIVVYKNSIPAIYEGNVFPSNISDIFGLYYTPHLYSSYVDVTDLVQLRYNFTHENQSSPVQLVYEVNGALYASNISVQVLPDTGTGIKNLREIYVSSPPAKRVYTAGESFNPAGMVVKAGYTDYTTAVIGGYDYNPKGALTTADTEITISYQGQITKLPITVNAPLPILTGIGIAHLPNNINYIVGEALNLTGLIVVANYDIISTQVVTDYTTDPADGYILNKVGEQTVTVSYTEGGITETAYFTVNVAPFIDPDAPQVNVPRVTGRAGGTVTIPVTLANNPGITTFGLVLQYDNTRLRYDSAAVGDILTSGFDPELMHEQMGLPENQMRFYAFTTGYPVDTGSTLFTLKFEIIDGTDSGEIDGEDFKFFYTFDWFNSEKQRWESDEDGFTLIDGKEYYEISQGSIKVSPVLLGDVNEDTRVDTIDQTRMNRYFSWIDRTSTFNMANADVTCDGRTDTIDQTRMNRYFSWIDRTPFCEAPVVPAPASSFFEIMPLSGIDEPTVTVSSASGKPGEKVTLNVTLENNPGITTFGFAMQYDDTRLRYDSVASGDILTFPPDFDPKKMSELMGLAENQLRFFAYSPTGSPVSAGTTLFTVTFEIIEGIAPGVINGEDFEFFYMFDWFNPEKDRWESYEDGFTLIDGKEYYDFSQGEIVVLPTPVYLTGITAVPNPARGDFYVGDTLNQADIIVTAFYSDGSSKTVAGFSYDPSELDTPGVQIINVSYTEDGVTKTVSFNIPVIPVELDHIVVNADAAQKSYFVGDTLNTSGVVVTAFYNDGKDAVVAADGFSPTNLNTPGPQTITVSYQGKTDTYTVTVAAIELNRIEVNADAAQKSYFVGDTLNTSGVVVTAFYNDGKDAVVTADGFSPTNLNTPGPQTITVSYQGKTDTYTVTVAAIELNRIEVNADAAQKSYFVGDTLNTSGVVVTAFYNDGKDAVVTEGVSFSPTELNNAGEQIVITVSYQGKTDTYTVRVDPVVVDHIVVNADAAQKSYFVGDTLNTAGVVVTAFYNDGKNAVVTEGVSFSPTVLENAGEQIVITVSYEGKSDTFNVTVRPVTVESISVTPPTKTIYNVGDTLDLAGMVVTATYSNTTTADVTAFVSTTPENGAVLNTVGVQPVAVSYTEDGVMVTLPIGFTVEVKAVETAVPILEIVCFEVVGTTRIGLTQYDYEVRAYAKNIGNASVENATAVLVGYPSNTTVIRGGFTFGAIPVGETAPSEDTLIIRIDRTSVFDEALLDFTFDYAPQ